VVFQCRQEVQLKGVKDMGFDKFHNYLLARIKLGRCTRTINHEGVQYKRKTYSLKDFRHRIPHVAKTTLFIRSEIPPFNMPSCENGMKVPFIYRLT
jgi:hypothetical protein